MGLEDYGAMYPRATIGQPEDIAHLCVFLASDQAMNITGKRNLIYSRTQIVSHEI